jgi:hypothetical protein
MSRRTLSPQLADEINKKILELEAEDKYVKSFLGEMEAGGSSSVLDDKGIRKGTMIPVYFGSANTFIANPSNVGIGILARMIETDATVLSAVQFKSLMMLSKIGEYQNDDKDIEEFVRGFISRMEGPTFKESLEAQSSNYGYGFSVSEIVWGLNKQNQKVPVKIPTYHPSTIAFEVDPYGEITPDGIVQFVVQNAQISNPNQFFPSFQYGFNVKNPFSTPEDRLLPYRMPFINNYGLTRIPRSKVVHHTNSSMLSFGSPYGKSPVRTAHLAWQLKVFVMKQMGIACKRQASPFLWGTAPHSVNKVKVAMPDGTTRDLNPIEAFTSILAAREGDDSIVTGPEKDGYKLEAISAQMDLNQFLAVLNWLDTQIFRAFLLPSLVMTDGAAGSRSLGDKHFQVVDRIAEEESQTFGSTVINSVIKRAIVENYGEQDNYGHFAQRPQSIEERERLANMFSSLANTGFMRAYDETDGEYVRSTLHLPKQEKSFYTEVMPNLDPIDDEDPTSDESSGGGG